MKRGFLYTVLAIIAILLILLSLIFLFARPWYYRLFYFGPRVSGTVYVEMDGEVYRLKADEFTVEERELRGERISVKEKADGGARVSIESGSYGLYKFSLRLEGLDRPIDIGSYQANWWNVTRFELYIRVDRASGTVSFESTAKELDESGNWYSKSYSDTRSLSDEKLEYWVVSV